MNKLILNCVYYLQKQQEAFESELKAAKTKEARAFAAGKLWGGKAAELEIAAFEKRMQEAWEAALNLKKKGFSAAFQRGAAYIADAISDQLTTLEREDVLRIKAQKKIKPLRTEQKRLTFKVWKFLAGSGSFKIKAMDELAQQLMKGAQR
jgi:predicted transcriptional regulator of viral defense system